jgi:membrane protein DedA with SNARE-associated domain
MSLSELISTYGYAAIAIGTFLEGETILVLGGFAAHRGYLELPWVLVSAFLGTLLGDQLYFYIGRAKGQSVLDKRPVWKSKSEKVFSLLNKHQVLLILGFRFLYGLRTVTPFVLGSSRIAPSFFLILNILGAFTWTMVIGVMGYLFGHTVEVIIGDIKHYELWVFIGLAALGVIIWSVHLLFKKRVSANKPVKPTQ